MPTVGLDALRWFWTTRTPQETADEIAQLVDTYTARWGVAKVLLTGYSFGADVLPETCLALPPETAGAGRADLLLAPSQQADWQITVAGWLGSSSSKARPTGPALAKMPPAVIQCIQGQEEDDSACPALATVRGRAIVTKGGHHFDGDYKALAAKILPASPPARPASPRRRPRPRRPRRNPLKARSTRVDRLTPPARGVTGPELRSHAARLSAGEGNRRRIGVARAAGRRAVSQAEPAPLPESPAPAGQPGAVSRRGTRG